MNRKVYIKTFILFIGICMLFNLSVIAKINMQTGQEKVKNKLISNDVRVIQEKKIENGYSFLLEIKTSD